MNKYKRFLIPFLILLALGVGFYLARNSNRVTSIPTKTTSQKSQASLSINDGAKTQNFDISPFIGKTALEASQNVAKMVVSGTGSNAFVTGINGKLVDTKKHEFWELLANGKPTDVGAGSYIIQNGDSLEWHTTTY